MKAIISALLGMCLAFSVSGQQPGARAPRGIDPLTGLPAGQSPKPAGLRFDIDFPGGPPGMLVDLIFQATKSRPNVVIHPDCEDSGQPAISLRDVTIQQIFQTLNSLAEPEYAAGIWRQVPYMDDGEVWTITKFNKGADGGMPGMYGGMVASQPVQPSRPRQVKIFNLSQYLEEFRVEDITTAVQGAWDLLGNENRIAPKIKYHKDTRLLIVVGIDAEINVVADVLLQLSSSLGSKKPDANPPAEKPKPTAPDKKL